MTYGMIMIYFYWIVHGKAQIIHAYAIQRTKVTTSLSAHAQLARSTTTQELVD